MLAASPSSRQEYQAKLGFALFLVSLAVFFVASLAAYVVIRFTVGLDRHLPLETFPWGLAVSTVSVVGVSIALHRGVIAVRRERQQRFHLWLWIASCLACLFLLFQIQGLGELLRTHIAEMAGGGKLHGLMFVLVLVHALHVLGGMLVLIYVKHKANQDAYDHEKHWGVEICAGYWHFLDLVWIVMLAVFLIAR